MFLTKTLSISCAALLVFSSVESTTTKPTRRTDALSVKRHESFVERANKGNVDVLFVGDSITQSWENEGKKTWDEKFGGWKPANFGISGDRTEHVLWRITEGKELEGIDPKVIVLMIGTNNMTSNSAEEIGAGVKAIVEEFRKQKPRAKVLLLGIFPRAGQKPKDPELVQASELQPKVGAVNTIIAKLDDGKNVLYLDIGPKFLDRSGALAKSIMPDYLHLSPEAYAIWAAAIETRVKEMLGR